MTVARCQKSTDTAGGLPRHSKAGILDGRGMLLRKTTTTKMHNMRYNNK
jgi:hypothetical protein